MPLVILNIRKNVTKFYPIQERGRLLSVRLAFYPIDPIRVPKIHKFLNSRFWKTTYIIFFKFHDMSVNNPDK
jgi:hypothetical protein